MAGTPCPRCGRKLPGNLGGNALHILTCTGKKGKGPKTNLRPR